MTTELHPDSTRSDERQSLGQVGPPAEPPPATPAIPPMDMGAVRQEAPPPATPPTPPGGGIVAWLQRMPLGGRWALGLGLAFLCGLAVMARGWSVMYLVVALALALAAGFALTNWWASLALDATAMVAGFVGAWVYYVQVSPGTKVFGLTGMALVLTAFAWFAAFFVLPLLVVFLGGVGLGKLQGLALGQPHALSAGEARVSRWIAALAPPLVAGLAAYSYSGVINVDLTNLAHVDIGSGVVSLLATLVLSATCLLAGWLLRSWWGALATLVAYAGPAFVVALGFDGILGAWLIIRFILYILVPAVVMTAIGTAIGMYGGRQGGQRPRYTQLAT